MALTDKNLIITPNIGSSSDPIIQFVGASTAVGPTTITATMYPTNSGTLSFDSTAGSLFSISGILTTGSIFSVNPISGIPIIDVNANRTIALNPSGIGSVGIGTTNPSSKLQVIGSIKATSSIDSDTQFLGQANDTVTTPSFSWTGDTTTGFYRPSAGNLAFSVSGIEELRINTTGVGVGSTNPTAALTIATTGSATAGASQIYLNGATSNRIDFNGNGVAAPAFTTRSAGTKIVLYPAITAAAADYALGIESSTLWSSVPTTAEQFRWYGGTTNIATLTGAGVLTIAGGLNADYVGLTAATVTGNSTSAISVAVGGGSVATVSFANTTTAATVNITGAVTNQTVYIYGTNGANFAKAVTVQVGGVTIPAAQFSTGSSVANGGSWAAASKYMIYVNFIGGAAAANAYTKLI